MDSTEGRMSQGHQYPPPERINRMADQIDSIERMLVDGTPADEVFRRFKDVEERLVDVIEYERANPGASAHCMRRSIEDALNVLKGVQL